MKEYLYVLVFLCVSIGFILVCYLSSWLLSPKKITPQKAIPYECGIDPSGPSWIEQSLRYYFIALLFLVFEVEIIFLLPWVVVYQKLGIYSFVVVCIFIFILLLGLIYYWKKGVLRWIGAHGD